MIQRDLLTAAFVWLSVCRVATIKRYYATESCGHVRGPDFLTVLEFDKAVVYNHSKSSSNQHLLPPLALRNSVWECIIVLTGMPSTATNQFIGVQWRDFHIWDPNIKTVGSSISQCQRTYVTIYQGSNTSAPMSYTMCGKDPTRAFFEWQGDHVTFKFYADFRRNQSFPTTPNAAEKCSDNQGLSNATTMLPPCTTPLDTYQYPEVYFRVDISSFNYACSKTIEGSVLRCNESQRCLDESLVCDNLLSQNCRTMGFPKDRSDTSSDAPAYCFRPKTTTPLPPSTTEAPPTPFPWEIIVGVLAAATMILLLCWCCWRPGYIPWRLARLRNMPFFNRRVCNCFHRGRSISSPCLKCCGNADVGDKDFGLNNNIIIDGGAPKYTRDALSGSTANTHLWPTQ